MYCNGCGAEVPTGSGFCGHCGRPVHLVPSRPSPNRVANHVSLLGALWIVYSSFILIAGIFLLFVGKVMVAFLMTQPPPGAPPLFFLKPLLTLIGVLIIGFGSLGLAAGIGLMRREGWARMVALVAGCIALIKVPLGTGLGIYTLWVLVSQNSEQEYMAIAAQAGRA